jgi:hypothetical protein
MVCGGSVTRFAADAELGRSDFAVFREAHRAGGVATEAAQDGGFGIEDPVTDTSGLLVAGGAAVPIQTAEPTLLELQVMGGIGARDKRDGLDTSAKGPLARLILA